MAGASGLIGTHLTVLLKGFDIVKINRKDFDLNDQIFAEKFRDADIIINMAGAPVIRRWTRQNRKEILESRTETTRKLKCISELNPEKERFYISASGIAIYDEVKIHTEESSQWGEGYLAEVVKKWENEAQKLASDTTKVCLLRTGVVLAKTGGMMKRLLPFFRLGLGGRIGRGKQPMSWIHIEDLCRAVDFIIDNDRGGIFNMTAPEYLTNREFTRSLARALNRPAILIIPEVFIRLAYGRGASVLTGGQAVLPGRLISEGFHFNYPDIYTALKDIVN